MTCSGAQQWSPACTIHSPFLSSMPMSAAENIAQQLHDHVFGAGGPTGSLVNDGRLPDAWASRYLQLLEAASREWHDQPLWPRELVAAIHFASWYLSVRYDVWCSSTGSRNEETERELTSLRSPSEIFLMRESLTIESDGQPWHTT